ncbi:MAG: hypothetical protein K2Q03_10680 [Sphingobacteriaceae bacterium]|nr:hypothetical protein [Sphingobacteriaceae bacterium]
MSNKYEIEMLSLDTNADAIIIRYFDDNDDEYIVLIDAGKTEAHGEKAVNQIKQYSNSKKIHLAICTHSDKDHIGGFKYVIDNMGIDEFWIHNPQICSSTSKLHSIQESLKDNKNIRDMLDRNGVQFKHVREGLQHSVIPIKILFPDDDFYCLKLQDFRDYETLTEIFLEHINESSDPNTEEKFNKLRDLSAENATSAICYFYPNSQKYLFTGDATPESLEKTIKKYNNETKDLDWLQVPHHGSKNNITTSIMDYFKPKIAYISANKNISEFLVNYLINRGTDVYSTEDGNKLHRCGTDSRVGYSTATKILVFSL